MPGDDEPGGSFPVAPLSLLPGVIDVWRADISSPDPGLAALLDTPEQARAARFVQERDRVRWTAAHGILRALLGHYLDCPPAQLRFFVGPHGKPGLAGRAGEIQFNISHSAGVALYAFASDSAVGIDIEFAERHVDPLAIAARVFGDNAALELRRLDEPTRKRAFQRLWVRHEARLKCLGTGFGVEPSPDSPERETPWITDLDVDSAAAAALAVAGPAREIRRFDWPGQSED